MTSKNPCAEYKETKVKAKYKIIVK